MRGRLPVVLAAGDWAEWLEGDDPAALLRSAPDDLLRARERFRRIESTTTFTENERFELLVGLGETCTASTYLSSLTRTAAKPVRAVAPAASTMAYRSCGTS